MGSCNDTFYQPARETLRQLISLNYLKFRLEQLPVCQWLAIAGVCHCRPCICICTWQSVLTSFPLPARTAMQRVLGWSQVLSYQFVKWEIGNMSLELSAICEALSGILLYVACLWILGPPSGQGGGSMGLGRYLQFRLCRSGGHCHISRRGLHLGWLHHHSTVWCDFQSKSGRWLRNTYIITQAYQWSKYVGTNLPPSSWN